MHIMDNFLIYYLQRFDKYCFDVVLHGHTYTIGTGSLCSAYWYTRISLKKNFLRLPRWLWAKLT